MRTFSKCFLLCPLLLLVLFLLGGCDQNRNLTILFPKLGSADCAILMTEEATVLIDTGESNDAERILSLLEENDRSSIDLLIISHYDKDHVGGAAEIINTIPVSRVIGSTYPKNSKETTAYYRALEDAGLTEELLSDITEISLGGMTFTVYPPKQAVYDEDPSNNASNIVWVQFKKTNYLFTGDAMEARTEEFLSDIRGSGLVFDIIKLPHHGQDVATTSAIFDYYSDIGTTGIITCSKSNPENTKILTTLPTTGIFLTREGDITVTSNGRNVTVDQ